MIGEIKDDAELCNALRSFLTQSENAEIHSEKVELFSALRRLFAVLSAEDDLFIDASELNRISKRITGEWETLRNACAEYAEKRFSRKGDREKYGKQEVFNFRDVKDWQPVRRTPDGDPETVSIVEYWQGEFASGLFQKEAELRPVFAAVLEKQSDTPLRERKDDVAAIKDYLDVVQEILHLIKPFDVGAENGGDMDLQGCLTEFYESLSPVIPLYNQTRNYLTRKPAEEAKLKLMFDNPTLADGWDLNKEKANTSVIFCKDGDYYLGIMNPKDKISFEDHTDDNAESFYLKMVYKLLPGPNKMLPKVFFSKKNIEFYAPSADLLQDYQAGKHKKGATFDLSFCRRLIDFYKRSIQKHPDWSKFGFRFSCTESYSGIDEFYREVAEQGYSISFVKIPDKFIDDCVDSGKLFLFQIKNRHHRS